jgi:hypothetical protein
MNRSSGDAGVGGGTSASAIKPLVSDDCGEARGSIQMIKPIRNRSESPDLTDHLIK